MTDFNLVQIRRALEKELGHPVNPQQISILYTRSWGDYWENKTAFVQQLSQTPQQNFVVIHVGFEGFSLTVSGLVDCVRQHAHSRVFVFSPNSVVDDSPWPNIFWHEFAVTDEITRAQSYWLPSQPVTKPEFVWALFVGRRTMPRVRALFDCHTQIPDAVLLSAMNDPSPPSWEFWQHPERVYDQLGDWIASAELQQFEQFYKNWPLISVDNTSVQDQYHSNAVGDNRAMHQVQSLLGQQTRYLFEITLETMTRGLTFTPSEKTIRAITAQKAQVVYAAPGFLKHLRGLGFETWGNLWDEAYDQLEGPCRYRAMWQVIKSVASMTTQQQWNLYQRSQEICKHNANVLTQYFR